MAHTVDYDRVAPTYDRRYQGNRWDGVEATLRESAEPGMDVLEVGCGTGHWLRLLQGHGCRTAGVEPSAEMLLRAVEQDPEADLRSGRAEDLPWPDGSFDRVFAVNAIHHFTDKLRFSREAHRVLRRRGRIVTIGLDPSPGCDRWYIYDYFPRSLELDRQRYPSTENITRWFEEAGFADCKTSVAQHILFELPAREHLETSGISQASTSQLLILSESEFRDGIDLIWETIHTAEARGEMLQLEADLRLYATFGTARA